MGYTPELAEKFAQERNQEQVAPPPSRPKPVRKIKGSMPAVTGFGILADNDRRLQDQIDRLKKRVRNLERRKKK